MWPIIGGLVGGALDMFGQSQTNQQSAQNTAATNATNIMLQQQAQTFQQQMSNTAYQRASSDMKAAGLNPMMMFGSGSAASTPNVAPAHVTAPNYSSPLTGLGSDISKTLDQTVNTAIAQRTSDKLVEEVANLKANEAKTQAETTTEAAKPWLVSTQADVNAARAKAIQTSLPTIANSAKTATNQLNMPDAVRTPVDVGSFIGKRVSDTLSPISDILHGANSARNLFSDRFGNWP